MKITKIVAVLSVCAVIATAALTGCAQSNSPTTPTTPTTPTITSFSQIPAGTWKGPTKTDSSGGISVTVTTYLVTDGTSTAKSLATTDYTSYLTTLAATYTDGTTAASLWSSMKSSFASATVPAGTTVALSDSAPYLLTSTTNSPSTVLFGYTVVVAGNTMTITSTADPTNSQVFTKQ